MAFYFPDHDAVNGAIRDGKVDLQLFDRLDREHTASTVNVTRVDPVSYFAKENHRNWTRYLGVQDGAAYTRQWAQRIVRLSHDDTTFWPVADRVFAEQWPLPVGRAALEDYSRFCERMLGRKPRRSIVNPNLLPFDGSERAAAIVEATIDGTRVEAFGLVVRDPVSDPRLRAFRPERMAFRITGNATTVSDFCDSVESWWDFVSTNDHPRGRKKRQLSYEVAATAWLALRDLHEEAGEHRQPSQRDLCDYLALQGMSVGTTVLGQRIREWRSRALSWPPAVDESTD